MILSIGRLSLVLVHTKPLFKKTSQVELTFVFAWVVRGIETYSC